jgi:hypothetical protein
MRQVPVDQIGGSGVCSAAEELDLCEPHYGRTWMPDRLYQWIRVLFIVPA